MSLTINQSHESPFLHSGAPLYVTLRLLTILVALAMAFLPSQCSGTTAEACAAATSTTQAVCR
jgi:hypothetical protein